ncbi:MAG: methionine--tRNA ligase [Candidatus Methanoplasma sp.]|jgi:methionyl-tRNA synthetase|nr:methionine--tRNA ligase [Candidatus Methanoplasma sp.]
MIAMSRICISIAWPYANGAIHLGHVAGSLLPPDIFRRYNVLLGNEVLMVGGSDQFGTPITVRAEKENTTPEEVSDRFHKINKKAIEDLDIEYSLFGKTNCATHIEVTQWIFTELLKNGYLYVKGMDQYFCPKCQRFLPDRYVEGVCPKCGQENVRSDQCDNCGTAFEPGDLLKAHCIHCGTEPEVKPSDHYFLKLSAFEDRLIKYIESKDFWRSNVKTFTYNWLKGGLKDRAVTRDMSWGVPVPVEGWDSKVIYVWFDAVIGYLSDSIEYSKQIGKPDYWKLFWKDPEVKHYYFIGKDNIPFHSIIWPAMLMGVGDLNIAYDIPANEYLMFNGGKLSKSRGGAIDIPSVLEKFDKDSVRYYLSTNMPDTHDSEFTWEDFQTKINTELVSALGNFYHRGLSFTHKNFGEVPEADSEEGSKEVTDAIEAAFKEYNEYLSVCDFKKGVRTVMELSRFGNRYFDSVKPWALIKSDKEQCGKVLNNNLRIVKALAVLAWPFLPSSSQRIWEFLGYDGSIGDAGLEAARTPLTVGQKLREPAPVYKKVELELLEEPEDTEKAEGPAQKSGEFDAFRRLDLRAGKVVSADDHPDAEKLFLLKVDVGEAEPRQIVAGLKAYYTKEQMTGRNVIVVSNLKAAKLRGIKSEGMLLAADDESLGGSAVLLLKPSADVPPGTKINSGLDNSSSRIEYKDFQEVTIKVSTVKNGETVSPSRRIELPKGAPDRVAFIEDGEKVIALTDGKDSVATVEAEILDGANVR